MNTSANPNRDSYRQDVSHSHIREKQKSLLSDKQRVTLGILTMINPVLLFVFLLHIHWLYFLFFFFQIPRVTKGKDYILKTQSTSQKCWETTKFPAPLWGPVHRLSSAQRSDSSAESLREQSPSQVCTLAHFSFLSRPKTETMRFQCQKWCRGAKGFTDLPNRMHDKGFSFIEHKML